MSRSNLLPSLFQRVHPKFRTPAVSIAAFCGVAILELLFASFPSLYPSTMSIYAHFFRHETGLDFLADLYAFGAATSYSFVFLALIALRLNDPLSPRKFKIPFNLPIMVKGERAEFPLVAVIGFLGIFSILMFTLFTHPIGRIAGPSWLVLGLIAYFIYRRRRNLPVLGSQRRNWRAQQAEILRDAGELELMDEYIANVKASDARKAAALQP
jgi:APA family basic amino acid/polyamine antiporter